MTLEQTILSEISELTDNLKQDVANYVAFLKSKYASKKEQKGTKRVFGGSKGKYKLADDFDLPLEDFKEYT